MINKGTEAEKLNSEPIFSDKLLYSALVGLGLLGLIAFLLYGTVSTDLTCVRLSSESVECRIVRNTRLLKMSPIKISDPLAVDVITQRSSKSDSPVSYIAQIRTVNYSLPLLTSYYYKVAQDTADEVNHFLLESREPQFSTKFPRKIKHSTEQS